MNTVLVDRSEATMDPTNLKHVVAENHVAEVPAEQSPPRKKLRLPVIFVAIAAVCAGAWYAHAWLGANGEEKGSPGANANQSSRDAANPILGDAQNGLAASVSSSPAIKVEVVPVEVQSRNDVLRLTGNLAADERSEVASHTSGIVDEVLVDRGSRVQKGDVLVQLDPTDAKNRLAEGQAMLDELKARLGLNGNIENFDPEDQPEVRLAKASADLAATNLKRAKELIGKKVISDEAYDQAETEYELAHQRYRQALFLIKQAYATCRTAMAKLAILEKVVADTTIRAPFDGWVAEKLVAVGEQINSGAQATKVITLVRIDPLRVLLTVPQQDVASVKPGQQALFHVDSFPDRTFEAQVQFIAPVVNDTRSMIVEALASNPDAVLRPGMFVTAEVQLGNERPSIYAPASAVRKDGEVGRVFIVRDGVARERVVALGERKGDKIEIRSGLTGNEMLVANPYRVKDGEGIEQ